MKNSGKLLKISDERSIFIIMNEDGSYISQDNLIRYRNIGSTFEIAIVNECFVSIDSKGIVSVLDAVGNAKFHFPAMWLDTIGMKIFELQELGILKMQES